MAETTRDELDAIRKSIREKPTQAACYNFLGRVVDRGSFPLTIGRWVIVNPVTVTGGEAEGGAATLDVATDQDVPVVLGGLNLPRVGEDVVVERLSGRWVTQDSVTPLV